MFEAEKDKYLMKHGFGATRLKAVLFDMDGVLFDSMPNHAYSWSHAMTQFGLHITPEEAYMHEGRTGGGTIDLLAQRDWGRRATEEEKQTTDAGRLRVAEKGKGRWLHPHGRHRIGAGQPHRPTEP